MNAHAVSPRSTIELVTSSCKWKKTYFNDGEQAVGRSVCHSRTVHVVNEWIIEFVLILNSCLFFLLTALDAMPTLKKKKKKKKTIRVCESVGRVNERAVPTFAGRFLSFFLSFLKMTSVRFRHVPHRRQTLHPPPPPPPYYWKGAVVVVDGLLLLALPCVLIYFTRGRVYTYLILLQTYSQLSDRGPPPGSIFQHITVQHYYYHRRRRGGRPCQRPETIESDNDVDRSSCSYFFSPPLGQAAQDVQIARNRKENTGKKGGRRRGRTRRSHRVKRDAFSK